MTWLEVSNQLYPPPDLHNQIFFSSHSLFLKGFGQCFLLDIKMNYLYISNNRD